MLKLAHDKEGHFLWVIIIKMKTFRKYLGEFVYGAMDGTVTTFAIVAGSVGASLSPVIILVLGFANLFADGFSMAASSYLSIKSKNDVGHTTYNPLKSATVTFLSFVIMGFIPLCSFVFASQFEIVNNHTFLVSIILTALAFIFIGIIKASLVKQKIWRSATETFLIGILAASIAYFVGYFLEHIIIG